MGMYRRGRGAYAETPPKSNNRDNSADLQVKAVMRRETEDIVPDGEVGEDEGGEGAGEEEDVCGEDGNDSMEIGLASYLSAVVVLILLKEEDVYAICSDLHCGSRVLGAV